MSALARGDDDHPPAGQLHHDPARAHPARRDAHDCSTISAIVPRQIPTEWYATGTVGIAGAALFASLILWHDVSDHGPFLGRAGDRRRRLRGSLRLVLVSSVLVVAPMFGAGFLRREGIAGRSTTSSPSSPGPGR